MQRLYTWLRRHPLVVDAAGAFALLVPSLLIAVSLAPWQPHAAAGLVTVILLCAAMAVRRVATTAAGLACIAVGLLQVALDVQPMTADAAMLVVVHTAAKMGSTRLSRLALAMVVVGPLAAALRWPSDSSVRENILSTLIIVVMLAISWLLGDSMRTRRAYYAELEDRAERLARERDAHAQVAAAAERARIARELHDVVAHNVSVMVVQADGAAYALDASPESARAALETISSTGREALAEMRRLLGVLRSADEVGPYAPQPGVDQLGDLVEQVRGAGLPVTLRIEGVPVELPQGVELAAYRIVQEALTNTRKHAGPGARAEVVLAYRDDDLVMTISDDGRGDRAPGDGHGHGLMGMRERVATIGGTLSTGPGGSRGWRVRAVLPHRVDPAGSRGPAHKASESELPAPAADTPRDRPRLTVLRTSA